MSNASFAILGATLTKTVSFQSTIAEFPNPDRGFYMWTDISRPSHSYIRAAGITLTRHIFRLDAYRNAALPASFLSQVTAQFALARQAGIKMIPRFTYNCGSLSQPGAGRAAVANPPAPPAAGADPRCERGRDFFGRGGLHRRLGRVAHVQRMGSIPTPRRRP